MTETEDEDRTSSRIDGLAGMFVLFAAVYFSISGGIGIRSLILVVIGCYFVGRAWLKLE